MIFKDNMTLKSFALRMQGDLEMITLRIQKQKRPNRNPALLNLTAAKTILELYKSSVKCDFIDVLIVWRGRSHEQT
jgi:hypothetical protein